MLTITVGFETYGGVGSQQGGQQTLKRFLTQCENAGGIIEQNGNEITLEAAEDAYADSLNDVVAANVRCLETGIHADGSGTFTLLLMP